jgi:colanic acid/amylovoran biosynthesis protein
MIVEVTNTFTRNKGSELMLVAIREHFSDHSDVELAVDQFFGSYAERAKHGLRQRIRLNGWGRSRLAVALMPAEFRRAFGLVVREDVDVLLDAAGFAFGDQLPAQRTVQFAERVEAAKRAGKTVILLPQALGPFEETAVCDAFARIVNAADLVFARDDVSMQHARNAAGPQDHLRQAPDFTNLVRPELAANGENTDRACIVPNERMIENAETEEEAAAYVPFIAQCVEAVEGEGLRPVLLIHGRNDRGLTDDIRHHVGREIPLHEENDPVLLKRFLGESRLVVGSRFHALVGALSQGVPAVGTSWSHKYRMLFEEYGCESMLLPVPAQKEQIRERIAAAKNAEHSGLKARIRTRADALQNKTKAMWEQVDDVLDLSPERA